MIQNLLSISILQLYVNLFLNYVEDGLVFIFETSMYASIEKEISMY